jgi:signal transduction histidine kinase
VGDGPLGARVEMIARAADRCNAVFRNALAMLRRQPPARRPVDVNALVTGAIDAAMHPSSRAAPRIETRLAQALPTVSCDPDQMHQVIVNLLENARESLEGRAAGGLIKLSTARLSEGAIAIEVRDDGPGVPKHLRDRIFEAYFTTKAVGTGIGLALCRAVVEAHEGAIDLIPSARGARFRIILLANGADEREITESQWTQPA